MFSKDTYQNRRQGLVDKMSGGVLLFLGNVESPMNFADNCFPFRQDSSFLYYFGIQEPKLAAIVDVDKNETIIFGDELNIDEIVWMGIQETIKAKAEKAGVTQTKPFGSLGDYLQDVKTSGKTIHLLPPYHPSNKHLLQELFGKSVEELKPSPEFIKAVVEQREIKEEQEIAQIEKSVNISNEMHLLALRMAKPGVKEFEIVSGMQKIAADNQSGFSYPPILTINGQVLHNHYHGNTLKSGDLVLNDSGAENPMRYAGDLTRTFPVDLKFTSRQAAVYNIVHRAFKESQAIMKAGVDYKEVHRKAALVIAEGLIDLGIVKGTPEEAVKNNVHTLFFQTGVGHQMGLDVHDMEDLGEQYVGYTQEDPKDTETFGWKSLRLGKKLKAGMVVTVEPGIYFIPQLIDMWQADNRLADFIDYDKVNEYRDFGGIRIEDDFLITEEGYKLLGDGLISSLEEIEAYRAQHLS